MEHTAVIAAYARTPFHFAGKGDLARVRPDDLAALVVKGLLSRTDIDAKDIEDLILGCAFPEGEQGFNLARLVVLRAELPQTIGGVINYVPRTPPERAAGIMLGVDAGGPLLRRWRGCGRP